MLQIGKNGITETVVEEVKKRLKKDKELKIKFLKAAIEEKDKNECFNTIARETGSKIIKKVGFTVVLRKNG